MEIFEEIKERVSMRQILEHYGIYPVRGTNIYRCIEHTPDRKPSANIIKGAEKFHCFVCHKSWDIFDIVELFEKCGKTTSAKIIDEKFGLGILHTLSKKEKQELKKRTEERKRAKKQKLAQEEWERELRQKIIAQLRTWEQIEQTFHQNKKQFGDFQDLFFLALRQQEWLEWAYNIITGNVNKEISVYDLIFPTKEKLLKAIKENKIIIW